MSSSDAQKSEVHASTEDATTSPSSGALPARGMDRVASGGPDARPDDGNKPDSALAGADVERDRRKRSPDELANEGSSGGAASAERAGADPGGRTGRTDDESDHGGPLNLDDPNAA